MSNLEEQIKEAEGKLSGLSQSMIKYSEKNVELKKEIEDKEVLFDVESLKLHELSQEILRAEESLKQLESSVLNKSNELSDLKNKIEEQKKEKENVLDFLNKKIGIREKTFSELSESITSLDSQLEDKKRILRIEEQNLISSNNSLRSQIDGRKAFSEDLNKSINDAVENKRVMTEEVKTLQGEKDGLDLEISKLRNDVLVTDQSGKELSEKLEDLSTAINDAERELSATHNSIDKEASSLDTKKEENKKESDRLDAVRTSLDAQALNLKYLDLRLQKRIRQKRFENEFPEINS